MNKEKKDKNGTQQKNITNAPQRKPSAAQVIFWALVLILQNDPECNNIISATNQ